MLKILHIDTSKTWRGGQQQAAYLHKYLLELSYSSLMLCQPESSMEYFCRENNLPYLALNMHGELDMKAAYRVSKIIKKEQYTILHAHTAHALSLGIFSKIFYRNFILIATRRVAFPLKNNIFSIWKYTTTLVNQIVCISKNIMLIMMNDAIPKQKLSLIYDGIDLQKFDKSRPADRIRERYKISSDSKIVTTVAALTKNKDYETLLKAAKLVLDIYPNVFFLSLGTGVKEKELKELTKQLNIEDKFIFLGFRNDVGSYLKLSDIFVLTSQKEGLGSSILDALSCGIPVIATQTGGIPEIITHELNGLLVPVKDPQKVSQAILRLIQDERLRNKLSEKAQQSAQAFSVKKMVDEHLKLYHTLTHDLKPKIDEY